MFDSLHHWFSSLKEESRLFDHPDNELLHVALASVLYHIINSDAHVDAREKREFDRILMQEFDLDQAQADHLYQAARGSTAELQGDLHTIHFFLKSNPQVRMRFLQMLLKLIDVHGADPAGLEYFYAALHEVFPEVKDGADDLNS